MTASHIDEFDVPIGTAPGADAQVVIIGEGDLTDAILESFIERHGFTARIVDLDRDERPYLAPGVVIVRSAGKLMRVQWIREFAAASVVAIGPHDKQSKAIVLPDSPLAAGRLRQVLRDELTDGESLPPVHLSVREREVIITYTLGATVRETARRYFITENTVRSHFRRVMRRYCEAGRPVSNKSQLLIQLIADGWIDRSQLR